MNRQALPMGCVSAKPRANGSDVWVYRYRDGAKHRSVTLGTLATMDRRKAERKAAQIRTELHGQRTCYTVGALLDLFETTEMPERFSTASSYRSCVKRIRERFQNEPVDDTLLSPAVVETWLKSLQTIPTPGRPARPLSYRSKGHIKGLLHRVAEVAMKHGVIDVQRNPMQLVELRGCMRGARKIHVLTVEQFHSISAQLADKPHVQLMAEVAMNLGLRISEVLGLQWDDIDWLGDSVHIQRSVVGKHTDATKTETSCETLPLPPQLKAALQAWRAKRGDLSMWVFCNPVTGRPWHRDSMQDRHLKPAGKSVGIPNLGWHTFRHTYRAMLRQIGVPAEVQQKLMRHADISTTMRYGRGSMTEELRPHNALLAAKLQEGRVM